MTIHEKTRYVLNHPYTKDAVRRYLSGDPSGLKYVLDMLQEDMYHAVGKSCAKTYNKYRAENFPDILREIRDTPPPENLKIYLPIPSPPAVCVVVEMSSAFGVDVLGG